MFWEDVPLGEEVSVGSWTFTQDEIIAFAKKYDPQPFHIDLEAASSHEFGGIVASGFHVGSIWMKLMVENRIKAAPKAPAATSGGAKPASSAGVSPGFKKMRWHLPVRPGDTLTYSSTSWRKINMGSRKDIGIVQSKSVGINQHGEVAFSFIGQGIYPKRVQD